MKKLIDVTVSVSADAKFCDPRECLFCYFGTCELFETSLEKTETKCKYLKCQACLDAQEHEARS
jgi:hypothetical protein